MSGGTWDYRQHACSSLASDIRSHAEDYATRWDGQPPQDDLPRARAAVADLLDLAGELVKELDWHFAGDDFIDPEQEAAWMAEAWVRLDRVKRRFAGGE